MIRHLVMWDFKESVLEELDFKCEFERKVNALVGIVPGVRAIKVLYPLLKTSTGKFVLEVILDDEEALERYQNNSQHEKIKKFIEANLTNRVCIDYRC